MALSDLQTALANLEAGIATLSARVADPSSYTIEGLSVARAKLATLIADAKAIRELIALTDDPYEFQSRWIP